MIDDETMKKILHAFAGDFGGQQPATRHNVEAVPTPEAKRATFIRDLLANPEKFRKEWDAKALKENPKLTPLQLQSSWDQLVDQFGPL